MARTKILEALGIDTDDRATANAHEPIERLPVPTLDERASIYMRAVHGDHDFTSEEHGNARELILEAMAAEIAARDTWARDLAARDLEARDLAAKDLAARSDGPAPNAVLPDFEPTTIAPGIAPVSVAGLVGEQDIDQRDDEPQHAAAIVAQRSRLSFLSGGMHLNSIVLACAVGLVAAALGYWAGTVSQTARLPDNSRLANQASPPSASERMPLGSDPRVVAEAQRELASVLNDARLTPDEITTLLKRGEELVAQGSFRVARLVLEQAAEANNAAAAFALGQTYDPLIQRSAVRRDALPDLAIARVWYEKAKDLGSAEAARRLTQLPAASQVSPPRPTPK
jgi:hypothetical protein